MAEKSNKTTRVRDYLLTLIAQKQYDDDGRLPTEKELCERFGISRVPVNAALSELVSEGIITRVKGSGSFVQFGEDSGLSEIPQPLLNDPLLHRGSDRGTRYRSRAYGGWAALGHPLAPYNRQSKLHVLLLSDPQGAEYYLS